VRDGHSQRQATAQGRTTASSWRASSAREGVNTGLFFCSRMIYLYWREAHRPHGPGKVSRRFAPRK
jgi:hypothetical protein